MEGHRDLLVWQKSMDLVVKIYEITNQFPKSEIYGLSGQMQRAAVSIPSNIAEGQTRSHVKEFLQFLSMAQGSLAEVQTQIELAGRLRYLSAEQIESTLQRADSLSKQLYALRNSLADRK